MPGNGTNNAALGDTGTSANNLTTLNVNNGTLLNSSSGDDENITAAHDHDDRRHDGGGQQRVWLEFLWHQQHRSQQPDRPAGPTTADPPR